MEHPITLNDRLKASIEAESERRRRNLAAFMGVDPPTTSTWKRWWDDALRRGDQYAASVYQQRWEESYRADHPDAEVR